MKLYFIVAALVVCTLGHAVSAQPACRDRFLWPFASSSVWNMPIGSGAQMLPAGIYSTLGPPQSFHNDQDFFVLSSKSDPLVAWVNQGVWQNINHCAITGSIATYIQVPYNFSTGCVWNNNAAGFLMPDNLTLIQMQPLYRQAPGQPILALYHEGAPDPFPWVVNILEDGALGAHGGSGLSAVGGTIRLGELLPTSGPITHALKLELYAHEYYHYGSASTCYAWPATGCDGYAEQAYNGTNPYVKPGALLAIPSNDFDTLSLTTVPGKKIAQALTTYGGYIVDDTANDNAAICMEGPVNDEFFATYGYTIDIENPVSPNQGGEFYKDLVTIFQALHVVINNSNSTVGGGGTPIGPVAPPICNA